MNRRAFLKGALAVSTAALAHASSMDAETPVFTTLNPDWQAAYDRALAILQGNVQTLPRFPAPVLIEGATYRGIWQECGPMEALVYRKFRPDVARNSHMIFFRLQREDGQLPANNKVSEAGFGQIQMVVPIAATAWELARATGDEELLETAYAACSRWDNWLVRYRNTRGTGLIEGFCTYDTGNDNSPRWAGIPNQCPGKDARRCPAISTLPRLCPDLSATAYGGRVALAAMAKALGKTADADCWTEKAEKIRSLILSRLYVPEDAAFYDLDAHGHFVRIRSIATARVCGEHVPDQALFEELWNRQLHNSKAFWAPYPLPSITLDDPAFVRPIPRNSWGGASQALTALRAPRWFDHYGHPAEFGWMMDRWLQALARDMAFRQQMDPLSGVFTKQGAPNYSPAALVMLDFTWSLAGICEEPQHLQWNVRPGHPAANGAVFRLRTDEGRQAEMRYDATGADLWLSGRRLARIESGAVRVVTGTRGHPLELVGIAPEDQAVTVRFLGRAVRKVLLGPNRRVTA